MTSPEKVGATNRRRLEIGLGIPSVDFDRLSTWARAADDAGFAFVAVGDNPGYMRDTFVALTVLAQSTSRCGIGTATTNPAHRDPLVLTTAISSVATLAPGRVFLGLGRGRAHRTASVATLRTRIETLRKLWERGEAEVDGERLKLGWQAPAVPIVVAASGPRVLQLAGEMADGVIVESGVSEEAIRFARQHLETGARAAGRDVDEIDVWWYVKATIAEDRASAIDAALAPTAGSGGLVLGEDPIGRAVPDRYREGVRKLRAGYDLSTHLRTDGDDPNKRLLDDPELRRYLLDRFTMAGTPADWIDRIGELRERGVDKLFRAAVVADPGALIELVGGHVLSAVGAVS
jgi:5,10-methylenetetrahydromethanopterin reductase